MTIYPIWPSGWQQTESIKSVWTARQQQAWQGWYRTEATNNGATNRYYEVPAVTGLTTTQGEAWNLWHDMGHAYRPKTTVEVASPEEMRKATELVNRRHLVTRNRMKAAAIRKKQAERKAEALLLEVLSETQAEEWEKKKAFHVHTADGLRTYRIAYGTAGNVFLTEAKQEARGKYNRILRPGDRFCMHVYHPDGAIPHIDNMLAQKLLLESEGGEQEFLRVANVG